MSYVLNHKKVLTLLGGVLFGVFLSSVFIFEKPEAVNAQTSPPTAPDECHKWTHSNFPLNDPVYSAFAGPYDVLQSTHALQYRVDCSNDFIVTAGSGTPQEYVWNTGYISRITNKYETWLKWNWRVSSGDVDCSYEGTTGTSTEAYEKKFNQTYGFSIDYQGCYPFDGKKFKWESFNFTGKIPDGNWFKGHAYTQVEKKNSLYPDSDPRYFLTYICTKDNGWKCGCRNANTCNSSGNWQIQMVE